MQLISWLSNHIKPLKKYEKLRAKTVTLVLSKTVGLSSLATLVQSTYSMDANCLKMVNGLDL